MQSNDHYALSKYLLDISDKNIPCVCKTAFEIGSVFPDFCLISYIKRVDGKITLFGHNANNTQKYIDRKLTKLCGGGLLSIFDYFTLGCVFHYIADSFTYVHNNMFKGSLFQHLIYEKHLHEMFGVELKKNGSVHAKPISEIHYLKARRTEYTASEGGITNDCRYIVSVCGRLMLSVTTHAFSYENEFAALAESYEHSYYHRPI